MPRYTDDSKEKLRDAVDFAELVGRYTELRRAGSARLQGLCPFHDERTPSFGIDPGEKVYHCFGCGAGGDVFRFVQDKEGLDFVGALEWLADRTGVELTVAEEDPGAAARRAEQDRLREILERTATFYSRQLWESAEASGARDYLASRGLSEETLRAFRVGYSPSRWDSVLRASRAAGYKDRELYEVGLVARKDGTGRTYDYFRGKLMFPLADRRGRVLGFSGRRLDEGIGPKYVNTRETPVFHKGHHVYAADIARAHAAREKTVLLCEGYTDVIALHQAGIRNVVGSMGTALTSEQVTELQRLAPVVLLCLDADSAGQAAMVRAASVAEGRGVELRVVALPAGLDPADLVAGEGPAAMRALVDSSVPFVEFRVDRELGAEDLRDAEGKDRAVRALGEVMAAVPPSALREKLLARISDRTDLDARLVAQMLERAAGRGARAGAPVAAATGRPGPARPRPARQASGDDRPPWPDEPWDASAAESSPVATTPSAGVSVAAARDPLAQAERRFLASVVAMPDAGRDLLRSLPLEDTFADPLHRRAASYLQVDATHPSRGLPADDPELGALVAELAVRASGIADGGRATLDAELATLRLVALDRRIQRARQSGDPSLVALTGDRERVRAAMQDAIERLESSH